MRVTWSILTTRTWLAALLWLDFIVSGYVLPESWTQMALLKRGPATQEMGVTTNTTIKCLQCNTMANPDCVSGRLRPTVCASGSRYCIKVTGDSDRFVYRICEKQEQHGCTQMHVKGIWMSVCYHTCDTDGCNAAIVVTSRSSAILISIALVSFYLTCHLP
ncbi:uncharacterized protein LOC112563831 [Pomacea canaliculata]|uniref:uncharacterized protein LOC112563831 n=1 Tax=Pomacea canaliculata TaxID=400727 RepID=UPI000D738D44|nr:uncharacterized protein LOC112563831 [Pomacea canaliculata]